MWVGEGLWQAEARENQALEALGEPEAPRFGPDGRLADLQAPTSRHGRAPWTDAPDARG
jgi:hypothetical protein